MSSRATRSVIFVMFGYKIDMLLWESSICPFLILVVLSVSQLVNIHSVSLSDSRTTNIRSLKITTPVVHHVFIYMYIHK